MTLLPAFAIDGGRVPASMLRQVAWVATSGAGGVVQPRDFKVTALTTPAAFVNIGPGGAVIPTRYINSTSQQSYVVANDWTYSIDVPPAGASSRRVYVILRINDPQYAGQVPADPETATYCEVVTVSSLPTSYPFIALARIDIPANTAAITNAMITDLRNVANPRKIRTVTPYNLTGADVDPLNASTDEVWPSTGGIDVDIPEWATYANVVVTWAQAKVPAGCTQYGVLYGRFDTGNMVKDTGSVGFRAEAPPNMTRETYVMGGRPSIPEAMRGRTGKFYPRANPNGGTGRLEMDANSSLVVDIEFIERAE